MLDCFTSTVLELYPMNEINNLAPLGTSSLKTPSMSVIVPTV